MIYQRSFTCVRDKATVIICHYKMSTKSGLTQYKRTLVVARNKKFYLSSVSISALTEIFQNSCTHS